MASDLLITFVERRVLPLQGHPHLICRMSGHRDPSRLCTREMLTAEVARMVNEISDLKVSEGSWRFGKQSYSRDNPPPAVSLLAPPFSLLPWAWYEVVFFGAHIYMASATTAIVGPVEAASRTGR